MLARHFADLDTADPDAFRALPNVQIVRTEDYDGKDTLVIQLSEIGDLGVSSGTGLFEISQDGVNAAVSRGLSVIQGDADSDLVQYPDQSFDYVVLSHTIQATRNARRVLDEMLRIGRRVVVSLPNFGHLDVRFRLMFLGRMPVSKRLPYSWYDTPNIHFCTIRDFVELAKDVGARVDQAIVLDGTGKRLPFSLPWIVWNLLGAQAVFLLSREGR